MLDMPAQVTLSAGGDTLLTADARASADAAAGDDYGFIVLRRGDTTRRIPYEFTVERPGLESVAPVKLRSFQDGDTLSGADKASVYRWPTAPCGPAASYNGPPVDENGAEQLYVTELAQPAVNLGVAVVGQSANSLIDPWFLGSRDENDVAGYTGTPVNVNSYLFHYRADVQAAGLQYPLQGRYYVAVDSGNSEFTGRSFAGRYLLHSWINDVNPPLACMITTTIAAGRPTIITRTLDLQAGVDPLSLVIAYGRILIGAAAYDPVSGFAVFPLPASVAPLKAGRLPMVFAAGDFQEDKNVDKAGAIETILPNTAFLARTLQVVERPTVQWLSPEPKACLAARERLLVVAGSPRKTRSVQFSVDDRPITTDRTSTAGLYAADWRRTRLAVGPHRLRALVTDAAGNRASAIRSVKACRNR